MKSDAPSWTTLVVATHLNRSDPISPAVVIGFGLLTATRRNRDDWFFALNAEVADTLADEPSILTCLADGLPWPDFLIADSIEQRVFTPLDGAADRAGPIIAAHLRHRVARLHLALPVDLSVGRARPTDPLPHAESPSITAPLIIAVADETIVDPAQARVELEQRVIGDWAALLTCSERFHTATALWHRRNLHDNLGNRTRLGMTDRQEKPKYDYAAQCVAIIKKLSAPEPFVMPTVAEVQPIIGDIVTEALL